MQRVEAVGQLVEAGRQLVEAGRQLAEVGKAGTVLLAHQSRLRL